MIRLQRVSNEEQEEKYYNLLIANRKYNQLEVICEKNFEKNLKKIVLMSPDEIQEFVREFDSKDEQYKDHVKEEFMHITRKGKESYYIIDVLYKTMPEEARNIVYMAANSKTCPYCNSNFVNMIKVNNTGEEVFYKSTFELDHFYSKSDYPMLAVSLYNLIPVCSACNRLKGRKTFGYYPYAAKSSWAAKFSFNILNCNMSKVEDIELKIEFEDEIEKEMEQSLYLQKLYENHKDIALEIIQKANFQGKGYMESLTKQLGTLFPDKADIYKLIYGNYLKEDDWTRRPLAKFTYDIAKEVLQTYGIDIDTME